MRRCLLISFSPHQSKDTLDASPPEPCSPLVRNSTSNAVNGPIAPVRPVYKKQMNSKRASMDTVGSN